MYSLAEAEAEMRADEDAGLRNEDGHQVVSAVTSKNLNSSSSENAKRARSSTFFQKMFSAKNMDRALNGNNEGEEGEDDAAESKLEEAKDDSIGKSNAPNGTQEIDDNASVDSLAREMQAKHAQQLMSKRYPSLPYLGTPINFDRLVARNRLADEGMIGLMELVNVDVQEAIQRAKQIPVQEDLDRVTVTPEVSQYMAKVKSRKGLEKRLAHNTADIQKALAYRKSALIVMNSNYSNKTVRKIDPIYAQEARTIIRTKDT
jgi:hypothetical protein